jgi:hypothetical protein
MSRHYRVAFGVLVVSIGLFAEIARSQPQPDAEPAPYLRVTEEADGSKIRLELAIRRFAPAKPDQPMVYLVGAVHIADQRFYDALQTFLDAQDVVLFEGVKPPGTGEAEHDAALDDTAKATKTERRLRFLGMAVDAYHRDTGRFPASLDELAGGVDGRIAALVRGSLLDAWGHAITLTRIGDEGVELVSLGADGLPGGDGPNADVRLSDQAPLTDAERGRGKGIQQQLADALGLVFQLRAMTHDHPNWRNSDMSIDQVQQRLDDAGAGGDSLFRMLDGSSMTARFAGFMLRLTTALPGGQAMLKLMLVEVLSRADEMVGTMPGGLGKVFDVLIKDRNAVVLADLHRVVETEPAVRTVGIIYGAGHLPDMQRRLVAELGYAPAEDRWNAAIELDPVAEGLPPAQARQMREMVRRTIDAQLKRAR